MNECDPRPFQAISIDMASSESGRERFTKDRDYTPPPTAAWRCNLTALSQRYNLYFVASRSGIAVYTPEFPFQKLGRTAKLYIPPTLAEPDASGYIDNRDPHAINHLIVGDLGVEEILLVATDSGNIAAYHTKAIDEAVRNDPYRFSNDARSDCAGLRAFFSQCVHESAWGLAIHSAARMIAVSANVPRQLRHMPECSATVTIFAFALMSDQDSVSSDSDPASSEAEWSDWSPQDVSQALPERSRNYRVVLNGPGGHRSNIPSISFVNTSQDPEGAWLLSTDILGHMKMWQIWAGVCRKTWHFGTEDVYGQALNEEAGWCVAALEPTSFHLARTMAQFCGHKAAPKIEEGGESYDLTTIVHLTIPGRSHRHPFHDSESILSPSEDSSAESSDDEGEVAADHWSEDERSQPDEFAELVEYSATETTDANLAHQADPDTRSEQPQHLDSETPDVSRDLEDILLDNYDSSAEESEEDFENDSDMGDLDSPRVTQDASDGNDEPSASPVSFASETSLSHVTQRSSVEVEIEPLSITSPVRASPDGFNEESKARKRSRKERQSRESVLTSPSIPTIHCSTSHLRLLNAPYGRRPHIFCGNILAQQLPQSRLWRGHMSSLRRLNMLQQIPEIGVVVIASQFGRCAICALTRHPKTRAFGLRVDWIVPTKRQEKSGERPGLWLLGVATAPVQDKWLEGDAEPFSDHVWGDNFQSDDAHVSFDPRLVALPNHEHDDNSGTDDDGPNGGLQKRPRRSSPDSEDSLLEDGTVETSWKRPLGLSSRPSSGKNRRYRLMMTYADHTVLTYEISRDLVKEDSDRVSVVDC